MKEPYSLIEDISFRGMIHAVVMVSPAAQGIIKKIKCPMLPNSYHLITAKEIPGQNKLAFSSFPVLAEKKLLYIGQPYAILAGPELSKLEELAPKIELDLEAEEESAQDDIIIRRDIAIDDMEKAFSESINTVSGTYFTGIQEHWYSEPHGALAVPGGKGKNHREKLDIYTATQWPFHVKKSVAGILGIDYEKVNINPSLISLHLDGKLWFPSLIACHAALAAFLLETPVKIMLTRVEDFMYSPKRNASEIKIKSALGKNGSILGSEINVKLDLGTEGFFKDEIIDHSCLGSIGVYKYGALKLIASGIKTKIPPQGPMAGFGLAQGFFASEMHVSRVALALGQDPLDWRKTNFLEQKTGLATGTTVKDPLLLPELIDAAAAMSDYKRKWASYELLRSRKGEQKSTFFGEPLRGIGISTAYQGNGFLNSGENINNCSVELTLDKDGSLEIKSSIISSGTDYLDNWVEMAEEILGVDPSMIRLKFNSRDISDSGPGTLSRNIGILTRLVELCCIAIRKQRFRDPLPITVRRTGKPSKVPGWHEGSINNDAFARPGCGASVIEIEIDPVSLEPLIRGIWFVADGGRILSQRRSHQALRIGIIHALGWTCREKLFYTNGKIPYELYQNYNIPAPGDIPPISIDLIWNDSSASKGIGDLPFCCIPAAYVQAVSQAMDYPFNKIPLLPADIWNAGKHIISETEP